MGISLRARAENRLSGRMSGAESFASHDLRKLLHELSVHQVELEMQNEELRRVQDELAQSGAKYLDLYELAPVGYFTLSEDGQILEANLTAANLLGVGKGRLLGQPFHRFLDPESQDEFFLHRRNVCSSGKRQACELMLLKKDGDPFFRPPGEHSDPDRPQQILHIRTSLINIHEKKLATLALKERAVQNETLLNLLPHPAMLIDKDRKILAANYQAKKNGARIGGLWTPRAGGPRDRGIGRNIGPRPGKLVSGVTGGTLSPPVPVLDARLNGKPCQGVFSLADGEQNPQRLVSVVEDSLDAVTVLDLDGRIRAWNHAAERIYGYSEAEALQMTIFDLTPSRLKKETRVLLGDIRSGAFVQPIETRRLAKDGSLLDIRLTVTRLIQDEKIVAVATTERDLTEYNRWLDSVKELPQRILWAQEEERRRISQAIHSDFSQSLLALKMFVGMSSSEFPRAPRR